MPKRTRSHQLEDISRNRLHHVFEEVGWTVEDLNKDYGEDLLVRIFENGSTTPFSFFVQAKATDNISQYHDKNSNLLRYPVSSEHLNHWMKFQEPVLLTLWDSQSDKTFWTFVQHTLTQSRLACDLKKRKTVKIPIFYEDLIDEEGLNRIHKLTETRYVRLKCEIEGAEVLVEMLQSHLGGKIEYSPYGVLIIEKIIDQVDVYFFGDIAEKLDRIAIEKNISHQETLGFAIESLHKDCMKHQKTGKYPVLNRKTGKLEYRQLSNLKRYVLAQLGYCDETIKKG